MKARSHVDSELSGWTATKDRRWQRCPDCDLRGDLDALGRPITLRRHRIADCETCRGDVGRGRGIVPAFDVLDSYSTGIG